MLIVPVPLVVRLVPDAVKVAPDVVIVPPPKVMFRTNEPVEENKLLVNVLPFKFNVPLNTENAVALVVVKLSASVTVTVGLLTVNALAKDTPADVIVCVLL